jgi:triacylglycerol lipase
MESTKRSTNSKMSIILDMLSEYKLIAQNWKKKIQLKELPESWTVGKSGNILLVPGFGGTWVDLQTIAAFFHKKDYRIHRVPTIEPNFFPIEYCVKEIKKYIIENNLKDLIFIAHSKGGLISRVLLTDKEVEKRIKKIFTIAVPHQGTLWGYGKVKNLHELSYSSSIIKELPFGNKKIINITAKVDQHIVPKEKAFLKGATNIELDIIGHTRILESEETKRIIEKYL